MEAGGGGSLLLPLPIQDEHGWVEGLLHGWAGGQQALAALGPGWGLQEFEVRERENHQSEVFEHASEFLEGEQVGPGG